MHKVQKGKIKFLSLEDNMILYIENTKESTRRTKQTAETNK